ncbi:MAG: hypothetical protein KJ630_09895 [Proteobacteria bacterium]|nr:hypothetical protein [Pseudomonadota bacterium]
MAIFIFAVVVSSVYGAYRTIFTIIHSSEKHAVLADRGGFVLSRMTEDLQSLILGKSGYFLGEEQSFAGARKDNLSFLSSAQIILGKTDMPRGRVLIRYFAEVDDRSGLFSLYRSEVAIMPGVKLDEEVTQKYLLCSGLKEIRFTYHDMAGSVVTTWKSDSDDTGKDQATPKIPFMVELELVFSENTSAKKTQVFRTIVALPQQGDR